MIFVPTWFYVFSGAILVVSGLLQLALRPRKGGFRGFIGYGGPIFSLISIGLGAAVIYYGLYGRH